MAYSEEDQKLLDRAEEMLKYSESEVGRKWGSGYRFDEVPRRNETRLRIASFLKQYPDMDDDYLKDLLSNVMYQVDCDWDPAQNRVE